MKSINSIIAAIVAVVICTSCLKSNLRELAVYDGAEITSAYVYYRYIDESVTFPLSGSHAVKQSTLKIQTDINKDACTCSITASLPSNFPVSEQDKISTRLLVVAVQISTAAVISPAADSPALGTPADWSSPHKYIVEAADGKKKEWTVSVALQK